MIKGQNLTGSDAPVFVAIMNKGPLYSEEMIYTIKVSDLGAGDAYEVDDYEPVPIGISAGATQQRTFYPPGDVDKVTFVAKSNHRYLVRTESLAPLVDTLLAVDMGSVHLTNDDRIPGDLSSQIELQNTYPAAPSIAVTISNNGWGV